MKPTRIIVPTPPLGGCCWLLESKGLFVLEIGAGILRTIACTHAGAGSLEAIDGVPDEDGFFPDEDKTEPRRENFQNDDEFLVAARIYGTRNGRPFYRANPVVMGSWMTDAGFIHGLTLKVAGGNDAACAIASVVWMPIGKRGTPA